MASFDQGEFDRLLSQSSFLEELASYVRRHEAALGVLDRARFEARLGEAAVFDPADLRRASFGPTAAGAEVGAPSAVLGGSEVARTLGNVLPLNQQTNILDNPTLEGYVNRVLTTSAQEMFVAAQVLGSSRSTAWDAFKSAGTVATCTIIANTGRDQQLGNPFHSAAPSLIIEPTGAGTHEIRFRSAATVLDPDRVMADAPFLVGAIGIANLRPDTNVLTNVTSRTAIVEIWNETTATGVASQTVDLAEVLSDSQGSLYRLSCFLANPTLGQAYRLRVHLIVGTSAGGAKVEYMIGEPQLQFSYTADPGPFTPAISGWNPTTVVMTGLLAMALGSELGDTDWRFDLRSNGEMRWGPGTASDDVLLRRTAPAVLFLSAPNGLGPAILRRASCRVQHGAGQNVLDVTATALAFNTESDFGGFHDNAVNNSRLTVTVPGEYFFGGGVQWDSNAVGARFLQVRLNGTTILATEDRTAKGTDQMGVKGFRFLNAGDYIELIAFQSSGGTRVISAVADHSPVFWISN